MPNSTNIPLKQCSKCTAFSRNPVQLDDRGIVTTWNSQYPNAISGTIRFKIACPSSHHGRQSRYRLVFIVLSQTGREICRTEAANPLRIAQERTNTKSKKKKSDKTVVEEVVPPPQLEVEQVQPLANQYFGPIPAKLEPTFDYISGGIFTRITGHNFIHGEYTVFFGSQGVKAYKVDETTLVCLAPPAPFARSEFVNFFIWNPIWGEPDINAQFVAMDQNAPSLLFQYVDSIEAISSASGWGVTWP